MHQDNLRGRSYKFSISLITFMDTLPNKRACWIIADQLLRCGMSIGANLIEGKAASSRLEYKKFFEIALKSANETKYWLCILRDSGLGAEKTINELLAEVTELANMLATGVIKLKSKNF